MGGVIGDWIAALLAFFSGRSVQRAADAAADTAEVADAMGQRAQVDDSVRAAGGDDNRGWLRRNAPGPGSDAGN